MTTTTTPYPGTVTVFTRTTCSHCISTKELLESKPKITNVRYVVIDEYPEGPGREAVRDLLQRLTKNEAKSVPQIFFNGRWVPGGNANLQALQQSGVLDDIMAEMLSATITWEENPGRMADDACSLAKAIADAANAVSETSTMLKNFTE